MHDDPNQLVTEPTDAPTSRGRNGRVALCMITLDRPRGLERLLRGIAELTFQSVPQPDIEVVVVENADEGPAEEVVQRMRDIMPWPIRFGRESQRGIPFARNAAVALADPAADFITFLDDDEWPEPQWLEALMLMQQQTNADVVAGPVFPVHDDGVEEWIKRGRFFERPRANDGDELELATTGNVLIRRSVLNALDVVFDERLHLTGADDTHLFRRLHDRGCRLRWAADATVHESIPVSRAQTNWLVRRMLRTGSSMTWIECDVRPGLVTRLRQCGKGVTWILIGLGLGLAALARQKEHRVRARQLLAYGRGLIAGLFGHSVPEYERIHGS